MLRLEALPIDVAKEVIERVATEHPSDAARAVDAALRLDVEGKEALLGSSRGHPHLHTRLLLKLRGQRWDDHRWRALESNKASSSTGATSSSGPSIRITDSCSASRLCSHTTGKDLDTSDWFEVFGTFSRPLRPQNRGWIEDGRRTLEAGTPIRRDVQDLVVIRGTSTT